MTSQQDPNSSEYSPEQRRASGELSGEAMQARGELHNAWNDTLYGNLESSQESDGEIAVEDLTPRIDSQQVARAVDGDPYLDDLGKQRIDEAGLYRDAQEVQTGANEVLADVGLNAPEQSVSQREAMNKTTAEALLDGQDEDSGRLSNEDRRDARNAAIASELDKAMRSGDTTPFEHLPPSVASKVGAWLGEVGRQYGSAESAPNDVIAEIGAYVAFAEKVSADTEGETVTRIDPANGEVVAESTDDIIMRILDDEPNAMALLGSEQQAKIRALKDDVATRTDGYFLATMKEQDKASLIEHIRVSLLSANAERLAPAA